MDEAIEKLLNNEITLKEFLSNDELVEMKITPNELIVRTKDNVFNLENNFSNVDDKNAVLADAYIKLRSAWEELLNKEYFRDINSFMSDYQVSKIDIDLINQEVRFESGKYHFVSSLDLKK